MPEDKVFSTETDKPTETPPAETPAATPTGLSKEDIAALVAEQVAPLKQGLDQQNEFFAKLQQQATERLADPERPEPTTEDWATKFYNEPQGTVQAEIANQTAPALQQAASTFGKMLLDTQQAAVDKEFGAGTWAETFAPKLDPIVAEAAKVNPMSLMSPTAVQNAVDTIKGNNFGTLAERARKAAETDPNEDLVKSVTERVEQAMTGGIRRVPGHAEDKLDDEESQEFLKTFFKQTGEQLDPKRLAVMMNTGSTYDEWKAASKKLEGK
jgi:hypothetical protein